ncbi:single stranded DNA-binding domain-containing protein [Streptomyces halobius]|uniref:Uncharacterized protein n=1 Tax=Streptomyces halobius TaxID=2879846 RepID=A0ABY4MKB1_9ACTN|nr:hypothetical protein [Streptomyces halobius]UQA98198.1 hypothetical protein K9S39_27100 [Streptomyces halobius]
MRKLQQAAIVAAAVAGLSALGAGVGFANGVGYQSGSHGGPTVTAWAASASGATADGGHNNSHGFHPHASAPQQVAAPQYAPQPAPQYYAPQVAPRYATQAAPRYAPQPAPRYAPQPAPQAAPRPAPQAAPQPAPQAAPQPAPQAAPQPAPQAAPQPVQESGHRKHHSDAKRVDVRQQTRCRSHDMNIDILGSVGILNGVLGNALNGEGSPGGQKTRQGSHMGCNNVARK